jgi:tripartite-type tricarboxylate transporter receptor subunit TctC
MHGMFRGLAAVLLLIVALLSVAAQAEDYPNHPVRVIVPFAPGGPPDVIARLIAQKLSERWGQQVYVENHAGAGGNTGTVTAARATADGYTLYMMSTGFMVNPSLYAKGVGYDPIKDFVPVTLAASSPNILFVNPSVPAKSVKELSR